MHDPTTRTNRLIHEKSPYLLQHARNPVDWYPWGDEAFAKARAEDKPIFLSIGYSTCHWCHVMERESFENEDVAALLNEHFVAIKVDREERPDIDRIYMTAAQAMGVGGGWPLNMFLTPDLEPFFGGTYFPPTSSRGRAGMVDVLPRVAEAWVRDRDKLRESGARVLAALDSLGEPAAGPTDRAPLFESAFRSLERMHDPEHGGFGSAPKFPSPSNLTFLARVAARDPAHRDAAMAMLRAQLDAMRAGGIHDHVGGGFHRYSTDREWLVPHFEKMLYDQAQIAWSYLDGYALTRDPAYAETARGIFEYVARDLTSREGAFLSAEDADSEGEEGRFYVWTPQQIEEVVGHDDARVVDAAFGVTAHGNFEHGTSILHEREPLDRVAAALGIGVGKARARLEAARAKLLAARARRPRPHRDDKVIASWNGLMISAFARGARAFDDPVLTGHAERAAEFVWAKLWNEEDGTLARRWREGEAGGAGQLDDYADVAQGCLDLYAATFDPRWLARAERLTRAMLQRFWDEREGGFWDSPEGDPSVRVRMKDGFDGAELAGNSVAAGVLQTLAVLLDREAWRTKAARTFDAFARRLSSGAVAMPHMLIAMDLERDTPRHIVIAGDASQADTRALIAEFERRFLPHDVLLVTGGDARRRALAALVPFAAALSERDGRATAYVCVNYACRLPVTDAAAFGRQLDERSTTIAATEGTR